MGSSPRIPELDGLRGLAILAVMLFHYTPETGPLHFLAPVLLTGWIGVDLFFVLSGYLIAGILLDSAGRRGYYRNFIIRRSLRIFPLRLMADNELQGVIAHELGHVLHRDILIISVAAMVAGTIT